MIYTATITDKVENKTFQFEGIIRGEIVSLFYWNEDRRQKGIGSFTLEVIGGRNQLKGYSAFYATDTTNLSPNVSIIESLWKRKNKIF